MPLVSGQNKDDTEFLSTVMLSDEANFYINSEYTKKMFAIGVTVILTG